MARGVVGILWRVHLHHGHLDFLLETFCFILNVGRCNLTNSNNTITTRLTNIETTNSAIEARLTSIESNA